MTVDGRRLTEDQVGKLAVAANRLSSPGSWLSTHVRRLQRVASTIGPAGRLFLFAWSLAIVLLAPGTRTWLAALLALLAALVFYPGAIRRALRPRWLMLIVLMALPSLLLPGTPVLSPGSIVLSGAGVHLALRMVLRAFVILVAVDGLTASVDVGQIAGLFERLGFQDLGFALGVAFNLLPILRETATTTWQSLIMRGGLRRQPLRGLRYFFVTVISSALRRASDIALAAEARAYMPGSGRGEAWRLKTSPGDRALAVVGVLLVLVLWI